ncbi:hypothetical protein FYN95_22880 [Salmonella enterica]|nr:hypothetical protein [Salmonella enterica]
MEVNKISQIIALCDSTPVMLDTKILDAESAIKTLALIRQLAEEAQAQADRHEYNAYEAGYRTAHPKGQCSPEHAEAIKPFKLIENEGYQNLISEAIKATITPRTETKEYFDLSFVNNKGKKITQSYESKGQLRKTIKTLGLSVEGWESE